MEQLKAKGITVKEGIIQDATFITSDPGHGKHKKDEVNPMEFLYSGAKSAEGNKEENVNKDQKKRDEEERKNALTRRSKDGTWAVKNGKSYFGYKMHTVQGKDLPIIVNYGVTTASTHDSRIDLSIRGITVYRDKEYAGTKSRGIDAKMDKGFKNRRLSISEIRRNRRISKKRSPGERPYSVIKKIQKGAHVMVTLIKRDRVKAMFFCFGYNMLTVLTLEKKGVIA